MRLSRCAAVALLATISIPSNAFAEKLSMKECTAKFQAAREAGTPAVPRWTEFLKSECGIESSSEQTAQAAANEPARAPAASPDVTFPTTIGEKFASETPAKQRMKTCLEAYHANKAANTLGELRWVQKGGGYYSLCSAKLKASNH